MADPHIPAATASVPAQPLQTPPKEVSLMDLLLVLAKHKTMILGITFGAAVIAAGYSLTLPNIYTATTKILPPQ